MASKSQQQSNSIPAALSTNNKTKSKKNSTTNSFKVNYALGASCALAVIATLLVIASVVSAEHGHHEEHHEQHHEEKHHKFHPYKYGYKIIDHKGNKQWKQEESHTPKEVKGSYGYKDKHGLFREVTYIADKHGFRAHVKTNEPGTAKKNPAAVKMDAHPEPSFHHHGHHKSHHESHEVHHGHH